MNLDLLKKLVRLANRNPNENEANAAARKVCKMLEENNFVLSIEIQNMPPPRYPKTGEGKTVKVVVPEWIKNAGKAKPVDTNTYPKEEKAYDKMVDEMWDDLLNRDQ